MIDSGMPPIFVRLIVTWYCEQRACVRWGSTLSPKFNVSNGVRQGGILSSPGSTYKDRSLKAEKERKRWHISQKSCGRRSF